MMKKCILMSCVALVWCLLLQAQGNPWNNPVESPKVGPNGEVTFSIQDSHAKQVELSGQFMDGLRPLTKGENDIWSITVKIDKPDIYPYSFVVDGVQVADPSNMLLFPNERFKASLLEMPDSSALYTVNNVPHGKVSYCIYSSSVLGMSRPLLVYTPAGYEAGKTQYPVLYLVSGTTDTEETWFKVGRVNTILDNLIAQGKAEPMIVVMPYGYMMNGTPMPSSMEAAEMYSVFRRRWLSVSFLLLNPLSVCVPIGKDVPLPVFPEVVGSLCLLLSLIWISLPGWHRTVLILLRR